jgi:hypothetical protein
MLSNPPLYADFFTKDELSAGCDLVYLTYEFSRLEIKLSPDGEYESIVSRLKSLRTDDED